MKAIEKFISWLGGRKEFKGLDAEQIVNALNEMSSSDEGKAKVKDLMAEFKKDQKISNASEVLKAQNGLALRRAQRQEYRNAMDEYRNDAEMNKYRRGYLRDLARERAAKVASAPVETPVYDRQKARDIMESKGIGRGSYGDNRVLAKKAKAAATTGFDESMYNWDPNQEFDRARFRERKQIARLVHPEYNWRQRRAFALMDANPSKSATGEAPTGTSQSQTQAPNLPIATLPRTFDLPKIEIAERAPVWIDTRTAARRPIQNTDKIDTNVDWSQFEEDVDINPVTTHMTAEEFRNHPNFRRGYSGRLGHTVPTSINIGGVEYPIAVTTGMYGNNLGIENDHTYAYDPSTGKIRKLKEDFTGGVRSSYGFEEGSEWIDMLPAEGWKFQQSGHNMNYGPATYRTAYGRMNR